MNLTNLKIKLEKLNVPKRYYSLQKNLLPDRFFLIKDGLWKFYYLDERGGKTGLKVFNSEEVACDYFYDFIKSRRNEWQKYK